MSKHVITCPACRAEVAVYEKKHEPVFCPGCHKQIFLNADLFCGAGGTSTGVIRAVKAMGAEVKLVCLNHWPLAIETHQANHPEAMHYIEDIAKADPVKLVPWGWLDLLMASPECTHFSRARGGKPVNNQSRINPWAIIEWLKKLDVTTVLIENVPEFRTWGPVDADGQPFKEMQGIEFERWVKAIKRLGYKLDYTILNAADYGDATTRRRFFLIARKDKVKVSFPPAAYNKDGSNGLKKWRAAREIIDWDLKGRSLFDDPKYVKRPLSINTRRRIAAGFMKQNSALAPYFVRALGFEVKDAGGQVWPEGFTFNNRQHSTARDLENPIHTVTASWNGGNGLVKPEVQPFTFASRFNDTPHDVKDPIPTATNRKVINLVEGKANPFILNRHGENGGSRSHSIEKPLPTATGSGAGKLIEAEAKPFIVQNRIRKDSERVYDVDDPAKTITGRGGVIKWNLIKSCKGIEYKLSCTATPAPNEVMEYASQASFLEKLRTEGDILWTFFTRDKFGNWKVKPHAREAFYRFMVSWSIYMRNPAAFGFTDILATLPPPEYREYRLALTDMQKELMHAFQTKKGTGMFNDRVGVKERSKLAQLARGFLYDGSEKKRMVNLVESHKPAFVADLVREDVADGRQVIVWTVFDAEGEIIAGELGGVSQGVGVLDGSMSADARQELITAFKDGKLDVLISKPQLLGYGLNFQNCRSMIFSGIDDSFERRYQAIRRAYRFGQKDTVRVHTPYIPELEGMVFDNVAGKEAQFMEDVAAQERYYREALGL
jgi:DNA (cytosine-5)-methyltransferase 1